MFYQCKWEEIILILLTGYIQRGGGLDFLIKQCLWKLALTKDNKKSLIRLPCLKCVKDRFCSYISYLHFLWGCPARIVYNKAKRKTMRWKWTSHCVYLLCFIMLSLFKTTQIKKTKFEASRNIQVHFWCFIMHFTKDRSEPFTNDLAMLNFPLLSFQPVVTLTDLPMCSWKRPEQCG